MGRNTKRILSWITSAAMSVSAFAGLSISVSAEETPIADVEQNFDSLQDDSLGWTTAGDGMTYSLIDNDSGKALSAVASTGNKSITGTVTFPTAIDLADNVVKVQFDWQASMIGVSDYFDSTLQDSDGHGIFSIGSAYAGRSSAPQAHLRINGNTINPAVDRYNKWNKVTAVIDYETKRVLSIEVADRDSGTVLASVKDAAFLSADVTDSAAGFGLNAAKISGNLGDNKTYFDNFTAYNITNEYYKVTFTVKDKSENPVQDATVTFDGTAYTTDEQGQVVVKHKAGGSIAYTVHKDGYEAEDSQPDATGTVDITDTDVTVDVIYSEAVYTPQAKTVTITGGQKVMTAPHTDGQTTKSAAFDVTVIDQKGVDQTENENTVVTWAVTPENRGVSVDGDGVITVDGTFKSESDRVETFTLTPTVTIDGQPAVEEASIDKAEIAISDYLFYEPGVGGSSYGSTGTTSIDGTDYISTPPTEVRKDTITLPDPIVFTPGTAEQITFKTAINNAAGDTYGKEISFIDSDGTESVGFAYHNSDIGDRKTAAWGSKSSTMDTVWNTLSAINTWMDVSILYKTNAAGVTKIELTVGDKEYSLGETTAKGIAAITLETKLQAPGRTALIKDIVIDSVDVTGIGIEGADSVSSIADKARTKTYSVDALVIQDGETFTWTTDSDTITANATAEDGGKTASLNIPEGVAGPVNITVTSSEDPTKTATKAVTIAAAVPAFDITGPTSVEAVPGSTVQYSVDKVTDQFGDDITDFVTATWTISGRDTNPDSGAAFTIDADEAGPAVLIKATYADGKLASVKFEDVTLTEGSYEVSAPVGTKVMLWNNMNGDTAMKPIDKAITIQAAASENNTIDANGLLTVNKAGNEDIEATILGTKVTKTVTIAAFSKTVDYTTDAVDVSDLVSYGAETYTITYSDGETEVVTAADNKVTPTKTDKSGKMEIVPNYKFDLGGSGTDGYTNVTGTKVDGYGFTAAPTVTEGAGTGVQAKGVDLDNNVFEVDIPDGRYDMTFYKSNTTRTYIRVNGNMVVPEANYQDGDSEAQQPGIYTKKDVVVKGGVAAVTTGWGYGVAPISAVEITKKSDLEPRKTHIWLAGDSTVTNYRPTPSSKDDWELGRRRTGWGQLFEYYLDGSVIIDNYAHSGDYAEQWAVQTLPSVLQNAEAGDYLIIQFGINDRSHGTKTVDGMKAALSSIVDQARAKGIIPILQTPELCITQYGTQVTTEHTKPTGSGNGAFFEASRTVAAEKNVLLIDLADITGTLWGQMGRTWVSQSYFLYYDGEQKDPQHMSYQGAKLVAGMVAAEIAKQKEEGKQGKDATETFAGIPVNAVSEQAITYTDYDPNNDNDQSDKEENQQAKVNLPEYKMATE